MKKLFVLSLLATSQLSFAADILSLATSVLENDYDLKCSSLSATSVHCYVPGEPMTGLDMSLIVKRKTTTLKIADFNESETALMARAFDKGLDREFFGQRIAETVIATLDAQDEEMVCEKLRPNYIGRDSEYVLNPWWQVVKKSECFNSTGKSFEVSANLGSINRNFGFMKKLTLKKI